MITRPLRAAFLAMILAFGGCASHPNLALRSATVPAPPSATRESYVLQVGDLLSVKFYYNPELNEDVVIRPDGMISLQLVGDVPAAGMSVTALALTLKEKYAAELATPNVSVIVRQFGGERIYVSGEVSKPGVVPLTNGLTLYQAIQESGGLLDSAHRQQVILIRRGVDGHAAGIAVDIRPVESGEYPDEDVPLRPFDMVFVPKSKIADVNVFVDQYIRKNLPPIPFAIAPF